MQPVEIFKSLVEEGKNNAIDLVKRRAAIDLPSNLATLDAEIKSKGFAIVHDFVSAEECVRITEQMDELIRTNKKIWIDSLQSDHRIFFSNLASEQINRFFRDKMITDVLSAYERTTAYSGFTLANKLVFKPNNAGSGGGWHRDFVKRKQTKALLYLTDVSGETGPFQFIQGTHEFGSILRFQKQFGFKYNQSRFTDVQIDDVIREYPELLVTITGKKGTLILVDTRGIHRGKPIEAGNRYALTNYYWFNGGIPAHIRKLNPFV